MPIIERQIDPIVIGNEERIRYALMLGYLGLIMEVEKYARYSLFHYGYWRNLAVCRMICFRIASSSWKN